jgi:spermidine/putrescine transport system substrate-binding protein
MAEREDTHTHDDRGSDDPFTGKRFDRRKFLALTGSVSLGALLAACGGGSDEAEAPAAPPAPPAEPPAEPEAPPPSPPASTPATSTAPTEISGTVNMLAWPGHGDKELVGPFEEATGVTMRVKEYANGDEMIALVTQSPPGTFDVIMVDPEFIEQLLVTDSLEPLDPAEYPAAESDFFDQFKPSSHFPVHWYNDQMYAVGWAFGYIGLAYNTDHFQADEVGSYDVLKSEKAQGRLGWTDYWAASMGPMSMYIGNSEDPFNPTDESFPELRETLLSFSGQTRGFYGIGDMVAALANGELWVVAGGGNAVTLSSKQAGKPLEANVPAEGAVQYTESLALAKGAKNPDAAKAFINYAISPEGDARKAILPAYQGTPVSEAAWQWIADNEPDWVPLLQIDLNGPNYLDPWNEGRIALRRQPENQTIEEWQNVWEEFKSSV